MNFVSQVAFVLTAPLALLAMPGCVDITPGPATPASGATASTADPDAVVVNANPAHGWLSPPLIKKVIRANFGEMRACYEAGLRRNPGLQGRVDTVFLIGRDGSTVLAQIKASTLPDKVVTDCVLNVFKGLHYPAPEGGVVTVGYPIMFLLPEGSP